MPLRPQPTPSPRSTPSATTATAGCWSPPAPGQDAFTPVTDQFAWALQLDAKGIGCGPTPATLPMIDLDHFKDVNDNHDHLAGDTMLVSVAAEVRRNGDAAGRYGGEEIGICMPGSPRATAGGLARRIRAGIAALKIRHGERVLRVTCSIGVAELTPGEGLESRLERVDTTMYAAKHAGCNRVVMVTT